MILHLTHLRNLLFAALTALILSLAALTVSPAAAAPAMNESPARLPAGSPTLQEFSSKLAPATGEYPSGVYVAGTLALPIVQQPVGQPAFVSSQPETLTQFRMAEAYGTTGLLAHNTLAGSEFTKLKLGQFAALVFSNEQVEYYRIVSIEQYAALDPSNPYSDFRADNGDRLSAAELFNRVYQGKPNRLVFQTCVAANGNPSWGRLFIIAEPVTLQVRSALSQAAGLMQLTSLGLADSR